MVKAYFESSFKKAFSRINNSAFKTRVIKIIEKLKYNPELGKPMRYGRKGTRELYIKPFRISYAYAEEENKIIFLEIYHKDAQ